MNELLFLWILSMYKLRRISHKLNIKPFGLYSVCERFAWIYTSIKSTKIKFILILKACVAIFITEKLATTGRERWNTEVTLRQLEYCYFSLLFSFSSALLTHHYVDVPVLIKLWCVGIVMSYILTILLIAFMCKVIILCETKLNKYKIRIFLIFIWNVEKQALIIVSDTNPRLPPFLLYVSRCKLGVTFARRCTRDAHMKLWTQGVSFTKQLSKSLGLSSFLSGKFALIPFHKISKKIPKSKFNSNTPCLYSQW